MDLFVCVGRRAGGGKGGEHCLSSSIFLNSPFKDRKQAN